jgi:hypothetical protein
MVMPTDVDSTWPDVDVHRPAGLMELTHPATATATANDFMFYSFGFHCGGNEAAPATVPSE